MQILAYITDQPQRVIKADALVVHMAEGEERDTYLADLGRALKADIVQLQNGDHILIDQRG